MLQTRAGRWAVAIVMLGAFGIGCNEETAPPRLPSSDESPYPTPPISEPSVTDAASPDIGGASADPAFPSNPERSSANMSPDIGVLKEEDVIIPGVPVPESTTAANVDAAGTDSCAIPGNECTWVDDSDGGQGGEQIEDTPGILVEPGIGDVGEGGIDARDENGDASTSVADPSTASVPSG